MQMDNNFEVDICFIILNIDKRLPNVSYPAAILISLAQFSLLFAAMPPFERNLLLLKGQIFILVFYSG